MQQHTPPHGVLTKGAKIEATWCGDEEPYKGTDPDAPLGYLDQVTMKAQKIHKAPYILEPKFTWSGFFTTCVTLDGFAPR